ncbi:acetylcholine receptor subunit alpha-like 1 [Oppia nitens]|uniref:acetylcholine receptor subunit alpha-like 1 n=1 Tax=Oppia nitens TaxID=1686743 RepID=UPI0023DCE35A|nr:acetylcholine receptor subunit alpha-like 1 [Oppia nitens]
MQCNPDAKRLYDDLLSGYNRLIRPVYNNSDKITVKMELKLSQLIDVNLKNQIMTTNMWVNQEWYDHKLKWDPDEYGGITKLYVPSELIWLPDIVLYNNADGNYEVVIMTKAIIHESGKVMWNPPAIYKSSCNIDIDYFPFDEQECFMKFGSWTYDGYTVDLKHMKQLEDSNYIQMGMDLSAFYLSVEWDIMSVPAKRKEKFYSCCEMPYPDITFNITLRRKTLFYTVNLIIPCVAISFLSILVFYLPSDSGEKVSLSITIMLSLGVFFLLLTEIIPQTSLKVPLLGRYLLFTMILVTLSVVVTIVVLNVNFRSPATHRMAPWVKTVFLNVLPRLLCMQRPKASENDVDIDDDIHYGYSNNGKRLSPPVGDMGLPEKPIILTKTGVRRVSNNSLNDFPPPPPPDKSNMLSIKTLHTNGADKCVDRIGFPLPPNYDTDADPFATDAETVSPLPAGSVTDEMEASKKKLCPEMEKAVLGVRFMAQHNINLDKYLEIEEDWKFVAMVLDRLFLWIFAISCVMGTILIIFSAPSLYDTRLPIDIQLTKEVTKEKIKQLKLTSKYLFNTCNIN